MACFETGTVISLPAREAITLPHVGGATLRVTQGTLWLTQEDDPQDIVLRSGDNWVVESNGDTVVEAQNDAVFCVVGPQAATLRLPVAAKAHVGLLSALAALFGPPPRRIPYV